MYLMIFYQYNCIEHNYLSAKNIIFLKFACL